jgi:hypothetical protein
MFGGTGVSPVLAQAKAWGYKNTHLHATSHERQPVTG